MGQGYLPRAQLQQARAACISAFFLVGQSPAVSTCKSSSPVGVLHLLGNRRTREETWLCAHPHDCCPQYHIASRLQALVLLTTVNLDIANMLRIAGDFRAVVLNLAAVFSGMYAVHYISTYVRLPPHLESAGHWQFLTNLSLLISQVVFGLGACAHLFRSAALFRLKNNIHPIALSMECIVTGIYWPLRIMFLHILVKDPSAKFIPLSVDLCLHLVPVVGLAIDYFFFMPKWTVLPRFSLVACVGIAGLYWWWLKTIIDFENGGEYPYMFLNVPEEARLLIFGGVALLAFALFMTLRLLHDLFVCVDADMTESDKLKKAQ